jgi:hypothetical protein
MPEEKTDFEHRCYPSTSNIQVFRYRDDPPAYEIRAGYEGVRQLILELSAPAHFNRTYCVRLSRGDDFFKRSEPSSKRFLNYSIERFGLKIPIKNDKKPPIKDSLIYISQPSYWTEPDGYLIQVWRTRIFALPVDRIRTSLSNPLSLPRPLELYFEEIWHPTKGKQRSVHWIEHRHHNQSKIERFRRDALLILEGIKKRGRPLGTKKYSNRDEFTRDYKEAYQKVIRADEDHVSQKAVVSNMNDISLKTFLRRLEEYELSWPPE